jgi:oligopeptide/dipeptide ABC transporter ATP-binding protein
VTTSQSTTASTAAALSTETAAQVIGVESLGVRLSHGASRGAPIVQDLAFGVARGETLALVGESGCGKSMTALAIMGLLPPGLELSGGRVLFAGTDLAALPERRLRRLRGNRLAMIFQEPMSSLNPVLRIGEQVEEVLHAHESISSRAARARAAELLVRVRIPDARQRLDAYPHQLSGGQRQRVMIAAALACGPDLLIADEPTTALDVTTQAEILRLLRELQDESGLAMLLITHDLGVVGQMADRVMVMYAGRRVEYGPAAQVMRSPSHPYTRLLMEARPRAGSRDAFVKGRRLAEIPGIVPPPGQLPSGCAFAPRCPRAAAQCAVGVPPAIELTPGHHAACLFAHATPGAHAG